MNNYWDYPLVNIQKTVENHTKSPCLMAKSTISMTIFNSKLRVYQRVVLTSDVRWFRSPLILDRYGDISWIYIYIYLYLWDITKLFLSIQDGAPKIAIVAL